MRLIKICSIATAACFGASALTHGIMFWAAWRVSYFMIASPTDVVMGGFPVFVLLLWIFAIAYPLLQMLMRGLSLLVSASLLHLRIIDAPLQFMPEDNRTAFTIALCAAILGAVPIGLWGGNFWHKSLWSLARERVERPYIYKTGLRVAKGSNLAENCIGADVAWLGSSSAVLACTQGIRLIHKLDPLITELNTDIPPELTSP